MSRRKRKGWHKNFKIYALGTITIAALILAAFFAPQMVFKFQDTLRCREEQFEIRETQDITLLSTSYESSLYNRLMRFAEEKQSGTQMFVTSRELTPNQELEDFLQSDNGLWQDGMMMWVETGMFTGVAPYELLEECQATEWKQYVIYNENYGQGVDFIIWYVKLESTRGVIYHILFDAQTGSVYGIQTDYSGWLAEEENSKEYSITLSELLGISADSEGDLMDAWSGLAYYYGGFREKNSFMTEMQDNYEMVLGYDEITNSNMVLSDESQKNSDTEEADITWSKEYVSKRVTDDEVWYQFTFPYGEYSLDFRISQDSKAFLVNQYYTAVMDTTMGFPAIYELIPEFGE